MKVSGTELGLMMNGGLDEPALDYLLATTV